MDDLEDNLSEISFQTADEDLFDFSSFEEEIPTLFSSLTSINRFLQNQDPLDQSIERMREAAFLSHQPSYVEGSELEDTCEPSCEQLGCEKVSCEDEEDSIRDQMKKGVIIGSFILGGAAITGPIGLIIGSKIALGAIATPAIGALIGSSVGAGVGIWESRRKL